MSDSSIYQEALKRVMEDMGKAAKGAKMGKFKKPVKAVEVEKISVSPHMGGKDEEPGNNEYCEPGDHSEPDGDELSPEQLAHLVAGMK